jgi:eukaryotic-like serine/threonine-protein kinase
LTTGDTTTKTRRAPDDVRFGRYRLLSLLGKGGMSRVYRAVLPGPMGFEKQVALKVLDREFTDEPKFLKALTNEARLGGKIHHRNVVETWDFGSVDERWYMAMEYVDGWTLDQLLDECRLRSVEIPPTVVAELMTEVCYGLEHAHSLKADDGAPLDLVHRDLKPGNILVGRAGEVKVMDFGIAKAKSNLFQTTDVDVVKGTPHFMSPEQASAESLDRRSDLFSLGSVLHELLTLKRPWGGRRLGEVIRGILVADLTGPLERVAAVCEAFCPLLARLLARDREERPASATDVRRALREIQTRLPPGPDLRSWLETMEPQLPAAPRMGDFGPKGPPTSVESRDTEPPPPVRRPAPRSVPGQMAGSEPPSRRVVIAVSVLAGALSVVGLLVLLRLLGAG